MPLFLASIAVRTAVVLLAILVGIRIFGKREMGNMDLFDVATVLLLGNAVQNAMTIGSGHLAVGIVSAGVLLVIDRLLGILFVRSPLIEDKLVGEPVVIISGGLMDQRVMRREGVSEDEVMAAVREYGLADVRDVRLGVLEDDGTISIIPVKKDE